MAEAQNPRIVASAIRSRFDLDPKNDRKAVLTAESIRGMRSRLEQAYPGLRETADSIVALEQQHGTYILAGEIAPNSDFFVAEMALHGELEHAHHQLAEKSEFPAEMLIAYAELCEREAKLAKVERDD